MCDCNKWLPIAKEIISIAQCADEQEEKRGYYDTPGGIEHKDDAIKLIRSWAKKLQPLPAASQESEGGKV